MENLGQLWRDLNEPVSRFNFCAGIISLLSSLSWKFMSENFVGKRLHGCPCIFFSLCKGDDKFSDSRSIFEKYAPHGVLLLVKHPRGDFVEPRSRDKKERDAKSACVRNSDRCRFRFESQISPLLGKKFKFESARLIRAFWPNIRLAIFANASHGAAIYGSNRTKLAALDRTRRTGFASRLRPARARKKDAPVGRNNQKQPPVIISCQSDSFPVQSRPSCIRVASPFKSAHVMRPTNDPPESESVSLELSTRRPEWIWKESRRNYFRAINESNRDFRPGKTMLRERERERVSALGLEIKATVLRAVFRTFKAI